MLQRFYHYMGLLSTMHPNGLKTYNKVQYKYLTRTKNMFQKKIQQNIRQINNSPIKTHEQEEMFISTFHD